MHTHEQYMQRAMDLALGGWGRTNPNPLVGAVIVKDGTIIAEGFHAVIGGPHAEAAALKNAVGDVRGGTIYVNLEPCSHYGRTPPCAKAIIEAGIKEVVIAMEDPNPKVAGRGIEMLRNAGIRVVTGVLEQEAKILNEVFIKYITSNRPFVIMKYAMTLDGKIASSTGDSKWISGESARQYVHQLRDRVAAIMVGVNTILKDDPSLTTRLEEKKGSDPTRIIIDSKGRIPDNCRAMTVESDVGVIIATTSSMEKDKEEKLKNNGADIIKADGKDGRVDLVRLMEELHRRGIDSVLLEGGGEVNASAVEAGIVDKVAIFIAPKIIGGSMSPTPVGGGGIQFIKDAVKLKDAKIKAFGEDILVEGYMRGD